MQQTLWHNHQQSEIRTQALPTLTDDNQLLVEAHYSLVSLGTERLVISESIPAQTASNMRVPYMQGDFANAFTYGYSLTGVVKDGPRQYIGKPVHLLHPHQRYALVNIEDACFLPDTLDLHSATLISNMETAVNAVWDAQLSIGDNVLVLGYGIIGTLVCELVKRMPGTELSVIESNTVRAHAASKAGLTLVNAENALELQSDIAINTAANSTALQTAIEATGFEGTVIELGWHGDRTSEVKLGGSFHYNRKQIVSSQVSHIPGHKRRRWDFAMRKALVVKLLHEIDCQTIIDTTIAFDDAAGFFNLLRKQSPDERGVTLHYQEP